MKTKHTGRKTHFLTKNNEKRIIFPRNGRRKRAKTQDTPCFFTQDG